MTTEKGGRPRWELTDERREQIKEASGRGVKQENIARLVGLSPTVWYEKKKEIPELTELLEAGKASKDHLATTLLYNMWSDPSHPKHAEMLKFYMTRRLGWTEQPSAPETKQLPSKLQFVRSEHIDKEE